MPSLASDRSSSLGIRFLECLSRHPQSAAFFFEERVLTCGELAQQSTAFAGALRRRGIQPGDRVALLLPNVPEFIPAYVGILCAGAIAVPMDPTSRPPEILQILLDAEVTAAVVWSKSWPLVQQAIASDHTLRLLILVSEPVPDSPIPDLGQPSAAERPDTLMTFEHFLENAAPAPGSPLLPCVDVHLNDRAAIVYTAGTTGSPKGVVLTHHNLLSNAEAILSAVALQPGDVLLSLLPFFHAFGLTVCMTAPLLGGMPLVLLPRPAPYRVLGCIQHHRITVLASVPSLYDLLVRMSLADYDLTSLRLCISGGAALPDDIRRAFQGMFGVPLLEGYGLTEASPAVTFTPPTGVQKAGSIGLPLPGVELQIHDEADQPVPRGVVGEMVVRGPNVMQGYYQQPQATAEALRNGWLHTGDLGYQDNEGFFYLVDRAKDIIIKGGLNISPREIEEALLTHPAVAEAAVVGVPDPLKGEAIKAYVLPRAGHQVTEKVLLSHVRERIAPSKVPDVIEWCSSPEQLPKNVLGKIKKTALRQREPHATQGKPG
jgi:long-chain acyl-CoA synthetase